MAAAPRGADQATQIQQSIARIHDACQAPALAPAEYRVLFDVMSQEITANGLQGAQTLVNITQRAREFGLDIKRDDLRFIYDVVSESDPWFEQGTSASLFAGRFRNFVVARCRSQGLSLSADELDLIEAWFSAPQQPARQQQVYSGRPAPGTAAPQQQPQSSMPAVAPPAGERWWSIEEGRQHMAEQQREAEQRTPNAYAQNQSENEDDFLHREIALPRLRLHFIVVKHKRLYRRFSAEPFSIAQFVVAIPPSGPLRPISSRGTVRRWPSASSR